MFNESIYAFHVYHVMNFLPYSSRKVGKRKKILVSVEVGSSGGESENQSGKIKSEI